MQRVLGQTPKKISALWAFRRARGLCFKCGERSGKDHTCPTTVQMHVVEELLDMFSTDAAVDSTVAEQRLEEEENLCTLSLHAVDGSTDAGVMQLQAWLQGREILLLVDSRSSSSFVDTRIANKLQTQTALSKPCTVKVSDGRILQYTHYIPRCSWVTQGHEFSTDFKILTLGAYDAILGVDWLRKHSPMNIDWDRQHLSVTIVQGQVNLQAIPTDQQQCSVISTSELLKSCKQGVVAYVVHLSSLTKDDTQDTSIPPDILRVLEQFTEVFEEPKSLAPRRACDHRIPMIEGAQPVNIRPYRYKPELKNEIERK